MFVFDFEASAFLHHMVRNLVGTLVYIGKGAEPVQWVDALLQMKDRKLAAPTFSPDGLYFRGPVYEPHWGLPMVDDDFLDGMLT
jgi:tRNA pseudouridine38-40 synthase